MPELKLENSLVDDRYEVVERLSRGSFAEIFVARDREAEVRRVFARWELDAVEIGRVTAGGSLRLSQARTYFFCSCRRLMKTASVRDSHRKNS